MMRCKRVTYRPAVRAWWRRKPLGHFSWRYVKLFIRRKDWYWDWMTRIFLFSSSEPCPVTIWQILYNIQYILLSSISVSACSSRPWMASFSSWTARGVLCLCLRTSPVIWVIPRKSWWPPASTASFMWVITTSLCATCCPKALVSHSVRRATVRAEW